MKISNPLQCYFLLNKGNKCFESMTVILRENWQKMLKNVDSNLIEQTYFNS